MHAYKINCTMNQLALTNQGNVGLNWLYRFNLAGRTNPMFCCPPDWSEPTDSVVLFYTCILTGQTLPVNVMGLGTPLDMLVEPKLKLSSPTTPVV